MGQGCGQLWACPTHPALLLPDTQNSCSTRPASETADAGPIVSTMCPDLCRFSSLCLEAPPLLACKSWLLATRSHHSPAALGPNSDHHCADAKDLHLMVPGWAVPRVPKQSSWPGVFPGPSALPHVGPLSHLAPGAVGSQPQGPSPAGAR